MSAYDPDDFAFTGLMFLGSNASSADLDQFSRHAVLDTIAAQAFKNRFHQDLMNPAVLDQALDTAMHGMYQFAHLQAIKRLFGVLGMHKPILDAIRRQQRTGRPEFEWKVFQRAAPLLQYVPYITQRIPVTTHSLLIHHKLDIGRGPPNGIMFDLLEKHDIIAYMARAVVLGAQCDDPEDSKDWQFLIRLKGTFSASIRDDPIGMLQSGVLYRKLMHDGGLKYWYPTLQELRAIKPTPRTVASRDKMLEIWPGLGRDVELTEAAERARWGKAPPPKNPQTEDTEKTPRRGPPPDYKLHCHWQACNYHTSEPPHPMQKCSGSGVAHYCNRVCQTRDWKAGGHKAKCRALKAA